MHNLTAINAILLGVLTLLRSGKKFVSVGTIAIEVFRVGRKADHREERNQENQDGLFHCETPCCARQVQPSCRLAVRRKQNKFDSLVEFCDKRVPGATAAASFRATRSGDENAFSINLGS